MGFVYRSDVASRILARYWQGKSGVALSVGPIRVCHQAIYHDCCYSSCVRSLRSHDAGDGEQHGAHGHRERDRGRHGSGGRGARHDARRGVDVGCAAQASGRSGDGARGGAVDVAGARVAVAVDHVGRGQTETTGALGVGAAIHGAREAERRAGEVRVRQRRARGTRGAGSAGVGADGARLTGREGRVVRVAGGAGRACGVAHIGLDSAWESIRWV